MANLKVEFYGLDNRGLDKLEGAITWDGSQLKTDPSDSNLLKNVLKIKVIAGEGDKQRYITPEEDPEEWLKSLYMNYTSAYLRAGKAESF